MFRVKIGLIAAAVVAIVTLGGYFYVSSSLSDGIDKRVAGEVDHAEQSFLRSARLEGLELTNTTVGFAREDEFAQIFSKTSDDERRKAAFAAVEVRQARLEKQNGKKAAIIAVVDKSGKVVARDLNINSNYGDDFKSRFPSLALALGATGPAVASKDIWNFDGNMYRVGTAPIRGAGGDVQGALLVGYFQSVDDAKGEKARLGTDVAYFFNGKIAASSFSRAEGQSSESAEEKALAEQLFQGPKLADRALEAHEATEPFHVKINGEEWIAAAAPMPGNATKSASGFVVLSSLTAARAGIVGMGMMVVLIGVLGMLAALGAAMMTARRFLGPLDKIEGGVTEVINGNRDYEFESPSADFEGLANGLNVMLARLLGRPEPGEEDEAGDDGGAAEGNRWRGDALFVDEAAAAAGGGAVAVESAPELANEPAEQYYQRIWDEYVAARKQTGEGTEGLTADAFIAKLKQNEAALCKKYNARMVRFKVQVKGNQTTLKPVPLQ